MPWAKFVETRLFKKIGMTNCYGSHRNVPLNVNQATPHAVEQGGFHVIEYMDNPVINPADGVNCSAYNYQNGLVYNLTRVKLKMVTLLEQNIIGVVLLNQQTDPGLYAITYGIMEILLN